MLVSSMADQMFTTTAQMDNSILNVGEGKVLDIPNGKEKILDRFKNYRPFLKDKPNQFVR